MFIAHLPAGYLVAKAGLKYDLFASRGKLSRRVILIAGLIGSVLPDIDIVYFYTIDRHQHLHHTYWTHIPIFWLIILSTSFALGAILKSDRIKVLTEVVGLNLFVHLVLDTVTGKIQWLYPFSHKDFVLINVPAIYNYWVWNFVFHWTFTLEIALVLTAAYILYCSLHRSNCHKPLFED